MANPAPHDALQTPAPAPLYFIPGTMCDQRLWQDLWPHLADHFSCHHWPVPNADSLDAMVDQLIERLPSEPIHLVGFSLGGYLAMALASRRPAQIQQLTIMASAPTALSGENLQERAAAIAAVERHGYGGIATRKIDQLVHPQQRRNAELYACIKSMDASLGAEALLQQLKYASERPVLSQAIAQAPFPTHFICGDSDTLISPEEISAHFVDTPQVRISTVPDAGHMLPLEQPEALAALMKTPPISHTAGTEV